MSLIKETGNIIMNTQDVKFDEWAAELGPEIRNMIVDSSQLDSFQTGIYNLVICTS